jgi:tRNA(Ile)-lysidine synthase
LLVPAYKKKMTDSRVYARCDGLSDLLNKFVVNAPPGMWRDVHVGVALSGGPDSVALLRATVELKRQTGGKGEVFALHVNHKLRGAESDGDAAWCEELCRRLNVVLVMSEGNVTTRAASEGDGLEAAARDERYRLLTEMAEARGVRYLFFGHTRDDQVETVLFRILRGTGIRGLAGIAASRPLTAAVTLWRPLLTSTREEVIAYLNDCGQDSRFDSSNASSEFARNRIRTELLPLLRENYSPRVDESLARLAEQANELQAHIEDQAQKVLDVAREEVTSRGFVINLKKLREQLSRDRDTARQGAWNSPGRTSGDTPNFLVAEVLRLAWREAQLPEQAMTREWWCRLSWVAVDGADEVILNLPGEIRAEVDEGNLRVERGR